MESEILNQVIYGALMIYFMCFAICIVLVAFLGLFSTKIYHNRWDL